MVTVIKGHNVSHDESANDGVRYLIYKLSAEEVKVFFDEAYSHRSAVFEDHFGHKYKLAYNGVEYQLSKV